MQNDIERIRRKHQNGVPEGLRTQLLNFLKENRGDFEAFRRAEQKAWGKPVEPFTCLKLYILHKKTICFREDLQSQIAEMNRAVETARRADRDINPASVKAEWTRTQAGSWRDRRILEIIYILDREKEMFLKLIG
jgi:hypothetical protein